MPTRARGSFISGSYIAARSSFITSGRRVGMSIETRNQRLMGSNKLDFTCL